MFLNGPAAPCRPRLPLPEDLMTSLTALWIPLILSSVIVFVMSSIIHMVTPWHKDDYPPLPNQDKVMDALRPFAIPPADYMIPRPADMKDMKTPEFKAKMDKGPVIMMTVMPNGMTAMGPALFKWFLYTLVVGLFGAYIASRALGPGASYLQVFRFVGATTFAGYALALWPQRIWYHRGMGMTVRATIDGLLYALLTAGTFGWLWPK
jgi:hypothetical protein